VELEQQFTYLLIVLMSCADFIQSYRPLNLAFNIASMLVHYIIWN